MSRPAGDAPFDPVDQGRRTSDAYDARDTFEDTVAAVQEYMDDERFSEVIRLYSARQVAEQQGTIPSDYGIARENAVAFYARLRELFAEKESITTFGPYSPSQAVTMKRMGIEGIYLGGWATSAKGARPRTRVRTWPATRSRRFPRRARRSSARCSPPIGTRRTCGRG